MTTPPPERMSGFHRARAGRIHLRCPKCGRKQSNAPRSEYDPKEAALIETLCPKCCGGDFGEPTYFAPDGREVFQEPAP